jgi:hypothetical protein
MRNPIPESFRSVKTSENIPAIFTPRTLTAVTTRRPEIAATRRPAEDRGMKNPRYVANARLSAAIPPVLQTRKYAQP